MRDHSCHRPVRRLFASGVFALALALAGPACAQTPTPQTAPTQAAPTQAAPTQATPTQGAPAPAKETAQAPASPAATTPASPTPSTATPATEPPKAAPTPEAKTPEVKTPTTTSPAPADKAPEKPPAATPEGTPLAPSGPPQQNEIEPNGSPGVPDNATTENVDVPARPIVMVKGQSSYDDAFKSIKASLEQVKAAMDKAGLKPSGHPITIFSEPDDKGFKYQAAVPVAQSPDKTDLGDGVTVGMSPAGKAIKFQHRGAYDDIDSTYDVITAFLDAKGLQVDSPYIEEYLTDLTTADDPNLQIDIYVFVK